MGIYLNPANDGFRELLNTEIFVDKSAMLFFTNSNVRTKNKYLCVSRPRRFGKSVNLEMLSAYYSRGCDSRKMFEGLKISKVPEWDKHMNKYNVIHINMQRFLSNSKSMDDMLELLKKTVMRDFRKEYKKYLDEIDFEHGLSFCMSDIYGMEEIPFVILIDEWDCIFREHKDNKEAQKKYLDFIRDWLKDQNYVALAYMTGILPIKKYGTHSALNMFNEYSMTNSGRLSEYTGFTETEVETLCQKYNKNIEEMRYWYNGYRINDEVHLYCPRSVVMAIEMGKYDNYWTRTETYESLSKYISMNFAGLYDAAERLLSGEKVKIDINTFQNDMTSLAGRDDVLTLLVHLGYLGYLQDSEEVYIPNKEVANEYVTSMKAEGKWGNAIKALEQSRELLALTLSGKAEEVAERIERVHQEGCDPLHYNNEQALRYTVLIAYYYAREKYNIIQEMPAGKGYADVIFVPNFRNVDGIPIIVELKYNKSAMSAVEQIKNRNYPDALKDYNKILLVGINYDKDSKDKKHECIIEEYIK